MARPIFGLNGWAVIPTQILRSFHGHSTLAVHELEKDKVLKRNGRIRPIPEASGTVSFSAWRLAHAIKKADCLRYPAAPNPWIGATGFLLEHGNLFDWSTNELCLNSGMATFYADFTSTGTAGRVAQGMALLFLEDKGYAYVGRFESVWKRRVALQGRNWPTKKKAPDFIAEDSANDWVLAESKGGFAAPGIMPQIKGALKGGLEQLDGWDKYITPQPIKSFAIGTFLRESGDPAIEKSLIAFVDPPPESPQNPVEFPRDTVRRENYASWLSLMGLGDVAARLLGGDRESQWYELPTLEIGRRQFALSIASLRSRQPDSSSRKFLRHLRDWRFWLYSWLRNGVDIELIGLDVKVLLALGSATKSGEASDLLALQPNDWRDTTSEFDGGTFYGSIFSDGSLLGEMRLRSAGAPIMDFEWIEVEL